MGYLNNTTITVDAILTKKGRELLSKGHDFFQITKFALADDEIDYRLWNPFHPSGSNYYGYAIEQMPILEATVDETQTMRHKLVSLDKSTTRIPVVTVTPTSCTLAVAGSTVDITPGTLTTATGVSFNQTLGYTCILHNSDLADLYAIETVPVVVKQPTRKSGRVIQPIDPNAIEQEQETLVQAQTGTGIFLSDSELAKSIFVTGMKFRIIAKRISTTQSTVVTVVGNESGGSAVMNLTVRASADAELPPNNYSTNY